MSDDVKVRELDPLDGTVSRRKKVSAEWMEIQPGDGTRYTFIVMEGPHSDGWLTIAGTGDGAAFSGYRYDKESLLACADEYGLWGNLRPFKHEYQQRVRECGILDEHFVHYMAESSHSDCSAWTAVAAIGAAVQFIRQRLPLVLRKPSGDILLEVPI
tara:strand:- start:38 stop:508 length:471 start_codon:yes stop_codon:yes gene_type:complete